MAFSRLSPVNKLQEITNILDICGVGAQNSYVTSSVTSRAGALVCRWWVGHTAGTLFQTLGRTERMYNTEVMETHVCHNITHTEERLLSTDSSSGGTSHTLNTFPKAPSPSSPMMFHTSSGFSSLRTCSYCFFFFSAPNLKILRKLKNDILSPGSFSYKVPRGIHFKNVSVSLKVYL